VVAEGGLGEDISELPVAGAAPEWMSEKAVSIGMYFVASGVYTVIAEPLPVIGADGLTRYLTDEIEKDVGGKWAFEQDPIKAAQMMIDHIESKDLIIKKLVSFFEDEKSWVKRSAMNILANIKEIKTSDIPLERVLKNSKDRDPKVREASAGLLKIYGLEDINRVIDSILSLLDDESKDVRNKMVNDMVLIINKIGLITILSRLLKNLSGESSIELQRSIALILERTTRYEAENIKKRVISLLKIRCEMSQDPIICEALHKIREG